MPVFRRAKGRAHPGGRGRGVSGVGRCGVPRLPRQGGKALRLPRRGGGPAPRLRQGGSRAAGVTQPPPPASHAAGRGAPPSQKGHAARQQRRHLAKDHGAHRGNGALAPFKKLARSPLPHAPSQTTPGTPRRAAPRPKGTAKKAELPFTRTSFTRARGLVRGAAAPLRAADACSRPPALRPARGPRRKARRAAHVTASAICEDARPCKLERPRALGAALRHGASRQSWCLFRGSPARGKGETPKPTAAAARGRRQTQQAQAAAHHPDSHPHMKGRIRTRGGAQTPSSTAVAPKRGGGAK